VLGILPIVIFTRTACEHAHNMIVALCHKKIGWLLSNNFSMRVEKCDPKLLQIIKFQNSLIGSPTTC
jgi:hypothetical protein